MKKYDIVYRTTDNEGMSRDSHHLRVEAQSFMEARDKWAKMWPGIVEQDRFFQQNLHVTQIKTMDQDISPGTGRLHRQAVRDIARLAQVAGDWRLRMEGAGLDPDAPNACLGAPETAQINSILEKYYGKTDWPDAD